MRPRAPRPRLALVLVLVAGLLACGGCAANSSGEVRLRASSMVAVDGDMRMHYDTPWALRYAPP
jgi:hypothetical protein